MILLFQLVTHFQTPPIITIEEVKDVRAVSPTSSVTSNKKLEWDSGADIGYELAQKHKFVQRSASLPILTNLEKVDLRKSFLRLTPEGDTSSSPRLKQRSDEYKADSKDFCGQTKFEINSSTSDDSFGQPARVLSSSSSSPPPENVNVISTTTTSSLQKGAQYSTTTTESDKYFEFDSQFKGKKNDVLTYISRKVIQFVPFN